MVKLYKPIVVDTRMSDYGYWIVTISVAPARRVSVMLAGVGITPDAARQAALTSLSAPWLAGRQAP